MTLEEEGQELFKKVLDWLKRYFASQKPPDPPPPVDPPPPPVDPPPPPIDPPPPPPPPPVDPPPPADNGPRADGVKLGFRASVPKIRGFRNTWDITPTLGGEAIKPESGWGEPLIAKYGQFEAFQTGPFQGRHSVEFQSDNPYIMVVATNSDEQNWADGKYLLAGEYVFGVSWPHLKFWRCQRVRMTDKGQLVGGGQNSQGFDLSK